MEPKFVTILMNVFVHEYRDLKEGDKCAQTDTGFEVTLPINTINALNTNYVAGAMIQEAVTNGINAGFIQVPTLNAETDVKYAPETKEAVTQEPATTEAAPSVPAHTYPKRSE